MTRTAIITGLVAAGALAGCGGGPTRANAQMLIDPASMLGKVALGLAGGGGGLVRLKQVSHHKRIAGLGGVDIDVWVISARGGKDRDGEPKAPRGTVVLLHPLLGSKAWFLPLGQTLARRGWHAVLPDLRAHGDSGGKYITWGAKEKFDLEMMVDELLLDEVICEPIYAFGASMGGMVAVQYAALDHRCRGVMALSPPASLEAIAERMLPLEPAIEREEALIEAGLMAGFDPQRASAVRAASRLDCPLIVAHGVWDFVVPFGHAKRIYRAAGRPKKFITLPFEGHGAGIGLTLWLAGRIEDLTKMEARVEGPAAWGEGDGG